jgi:RNA polymerase sigma-70 factor (ECF subfamily)
MDAGDTTWLARAADGDESAFERLYAEHAGWARAYLRRCGFSAHDVDDLAQDAFLRVFRSLATYDPERGPLRPWLATVVRNVARKHWARRAQPVPFDPELAEAMLHAPGNPGLSAEQQEQFAVLGNCVDALPPDLGRIVRLRYVDGLTTRAVAETVRMAEATVRLRLAEAHDLLERCLKSKGAWP